MIAVSGVHLIGDVVVDLSLPQSGDESKIRLGGVVHCARALWAIEADYSLDCITPDYLIGNVQTYCSAHGASTVRHLGTVTGAPYLFLIGSDKETGDQLYDFILRDEINVLLDTDQLEFDYDDVLLISGNFDLNQVVNKVIVEGGRRCHLDLSNNITSLGQIPSHKFETLFISTSSDLFKENYNDDFEEFCLLFQEYCNVLILKENRGGSRVHRFFDTTTFNIPSITRSISHSIGVGDAFDACYVSMYRKVGIETAAIRASFVASEYAATRYPDDFKKAVSNIMGLSDEVLVGLGGCILPWEKRSQINIYIAAPDFDYMDTKYIDELCESLSYHNFRVRRPVQEFGQLSDESTEEERRNICTQDIELLYECDMVIGVYISDDPGTLIELGLSAVKKTPCLVYDPTDSARNNMLLKFPRLITSNLDELLLEVFTISSKIEL